MQTANNNKRTQAELDGPKGDTLPGEPETFPYYVVCNEVEKSISDERDFLPFELPNGLRALVVSDSTCDKAGAGVNVGVGHFSDEYELPGLAHFLEHMVFMGSAKFPDENDYSAFLSKSGGSSNACTEAEQTIFFFDVNHSKLRDTLERFAQFFIAPLMNESSQQRELKAVDSEHAKNLLVDGWRMQQLERSSAVPSSSYFKFGTGDAVTLGQVPKAKGIDLRKKLLEFHNEHYRANRMALVVVGREPVETLKIWVEALFSEVPSGPKAVVSPASHELGTVFPQRILNRIMFAETIKDKFTIEVAWELPPYARTHYLSNPVHYAEHLFGHESKGSLLANLKEREFAVGLSAGVSFECHDFSMFKVSVECTEKGIRNHEQVIAAIFDYAKMIRSAGVQYRLFRETQLLEQIRFRFQSKPNTFNFCRATSSALLRYPFAHVLTAESTVKQYDMELIQSCLDLFTPERARSVISFKEASRSPMLQHLSWERERWYGTPFALDESRTLLDITKLGSNEGPKLSLPEPNVFIPTNFDLVGDRSLRLTPEASKHALIRPPSKASGTPETLHVWYKQDQTFLQPKAIFKASLILPSSYTSPRGSVLAELSAYVATDVLNEYAYNAELAGLSWSFTNTVRGMSFGVSGYSDKLHVLLEKIVSVVTNPDTYRNEKILARQLDRYLRAMENFQQENPYQIAMYEASVALNVPRWNFKEKVKTLKARKVTVEELVHFVQGNVLHGGSKLVTLCMGNVTRARALQWSEVAWSKFGFEPNFAPSPPRVIVVPSGEDQIHFLRLNSQSGNKNSALEFICQIGPDNRFPKCSALTQVLANLAEEPCFNDLRTVQQLGYIVSLGMRRDMASVLSIRIVVQSSSYGLDHLVDRTLTFLADLRQILEGYSEPEFHDHIRAAVDQRLEADITLSDEGKRWWEELDQEAFVFDRDQLVAREIASITKREILEFYDRFISPKSMQRRYFISGVDGSNNQSIVGRGILTSSLVSTLHRKEFVGAANVVYLTEEDVTRWRDTCDLWPWLRSSSSSFL